MKNEKGQKRSYRKYDEHFKTEAVRQINQGRSIKDLSSSLGVSEGLLYRWKSLDSGMSKRTSEEVKQLKKELKQVREDNEILKKALSIFTQSG